MTIDIGCPRRIVAIHQACQRLRAGGDVMVIAGGGNLVMVAMRWITVLYMDYRF